MSLLATANQDKWQTLSDYGQKAQNPAYRSAAIFYINVTPLHGVSCFDRPRFYRQTNHIEKNKQDRIYKKLPKDFHQSAVFFYLLNIPK